MDTGDLVINLLSGSHLIEDSVMIGPAHSGSVASRTVLAGCGETILTGAISTPSILPSDEAAALQTSTRAFPLPTDDSVPHGLGEFGYARAIPLSPPRVFADDRLLDWTRFPEKGWIESGLSGPAGEEDIVVLGVDPQQLMAVRDEPAIWVELIFGDDWNWHIAQAHFIDFTESRVAVRLPRGVRPHIDRQYKLAFRNVRAGLSKSGSCWLDVAGRQLVFHQPVGVEAKLCSMPGHLVRLDRTRFVTIENVCFQGGLGCALHATQSQDISIDNCRARGFAAGGFHLEGLRINVRNSTVSEVGTSGIRLDAGESSSLTPGRGRIENCTITRWGRRKPVFEPAVRLFGVGTLVDDCILSDGPHLAIEVSGNDHLIEGCRFSNVVSDIDDMGAIYFNCGETPLERGHIVRRNFFHDIGADRSTVSAIYIDRASNGVAVLENLFRRIGGTGSRLARAVHVNCGSDLEVSRNLFVDCDCAAELDFYLSTWGSRDIEAMERGQSQALSRLADDAPHLSAYPALAGLADEPLLHPTSNRIRGNYVVLPAIGQARALVLTSALAGLVDIGDNQIARPEAVPLPPMPDPWAELFCDVQSAFELDQRLDVLAVRWTRSLFGPQAREILDS